MITPTKCKWKIIVTVVSRIVLFGLQGWRRAAFCQSLRAGCPPQICFVELYCIKFLKITERSNNHYLLRISLFFCSRTNFSCILCQSKNINCILPEFRFTKSYGLQNAILWFWSPHFQSKIGSCSYCKSISGCVLVKILQKEKHQKQKTKWNAPNYKHTLKKRTLFAIISYV